MQIKEKEIYSQLYKIVEQNMKLSGGNMEFSEQVFLTSVGEKKNVADILRLWTNDRQTFLTNIYLQLLGRFPESHAYEQWSKDQREDTEVKKTMVYAIVSSEEFRIKQGVVKNNVIRKEEEIEHKDKFIDMKRCIIEFLRPVARKLPNGIKNKIKAYLKMI